jgi:manganese oxidase
MKDKLLRKNCLVPVLTAVFLLVFAAGAWAGHTGINGITGQTNFNFTVKADHISTADGGSYLIWGYVDEGNYEGLGGRAQYPGPTIIVNQGDPVTINLTNTLNQPVSMIFPGQTNVTAEGGSEGTLTNESTGPGDIVTYTFVAGEPGTYLYHSGTNMQQQVEMGLLGALIVRPSMGPNYAYNSADTQWDREFLFLITEMDPRVHDAVEFGDSFNDSDYYAVYWFINGRVAPDNMAEPFVPWLPTQPYNNMPRMHPGEKLLLRVISAGRDLHPFHTHGNHARIIAKDARLLSTNGVSPDLAQEVFTIKAIPGQTVDAIFEWTGKGLNWDIYGTPADGRPAHECIDNDGDGFADPGIPGNNPYEYCADHGKPFPTILPEDQDLAFGGWYGGSPFLGATGALPPGEGGLNPNGGASYMWHSHTEKELTNFDIFPGGMLTMLIIEAWNVDIP